MLILYYQNLLKVAFDLHVDRNPNQAQDKIALAAEDVIDSGRRVTMPERAGYHECSRTRSGGSCANVGKVMCVHVDHLE
jgi:hypothetical protein